MTATLTGNHDAHISDYTNIVVENASIGINGDISGTLDASYYKGCGERQGVEREVAAVCIGNGPVDQLRVSEKVGALNCMHDQQMVLVPGVAHTLKAKGYSDHREDSETYIVARDGLRYIVRRLTPLECERLQGYPDYWTDIGAWTDEKGKLHKESADSARYKALGNSIALPSWAYVLQRLSLACGTDKTMASLFDGIGGFPLIWEAMHGTGSCVWASEIEDFPIAVTRERFSDGQDAGGAR